MPVPNSKALQEATIRTTICSCFSFRGSSPTNSPTDFVFQPRWAPQSLNMLGIGPSPCMNCEVCSFVISLWEWLLSLNQRLAEYSYSQFSFLVWKNWGGVNYKCLGTASIPHITPLAGMSHTQLSVPHEELYFKVQLT